MSKSSAITTVIVNLEQVREICGAYCECELPCYEHIAPFLSQLVVLFGLDDSVLYDEKALLGICVNSCMQLVAGVAERASQHSGISVVFVDGDQAENPSEKSIGGDGDEKEKSV
jgi:hypothetical protein